MAEQTECTKEELNLVAAINNLISQLQAEQPSFLNPLALARYYKALSDAKNAVINNYKICYKSDPQTSSGKTSLTKEARQKILDLGIRSNNKDKWLEAVKNLGFDIEDPEKISDTDVKPSESATNTVKSSENNTAAVKPSESATNTVKSSENNTAAVKPPEAATNTVKPPEAATNTVKPPEAATNTVKPPEAATNTVKPPEAATNTVKPPEAATNTVKPPEAATNTVKPPEAATRQTVSESDSKNNLFTELEIYQKAIEAAQKIDDKEKSAAAKQQAAEVLSPKINELVQKAFPKEIEEFNDKLLKSEDATPPDIEPVFKSLVFKLAEHLDQDTNFSQDEQNTRIATLGRAAKNLQKQLKASSNPGGTADDSDSKSYPGQELFSTLLGTLGQYMAGILGSSVVDGDQAVSQLMHNPMRRDASAISRTADTKAISNRLDDISRMAYLQSQAAGDTFTSIRGFLEPLAQTVMGPGGKQMAFSVLTSLGMDAKTAETFYEGLEEAISSPSGISSKRIQSVTDPRSSSLVLRNVKAFSDQVGRSPFNAQKWGGISGNKVNHYLKALTDAGLFRAKDYTIYNDVDFAKKYTEALQSNDADMSAAVDAYTADMQEKERAADLLKLSDKDKQDSDKVTATTEAASKRVAEDISSFKALAEDLRKYGKLDGDKLEKWNTLNLKYGSGLREITAGNEMLADASKSVKDVDLTYRYLSGMKGFDTVIQEQGGSQAATLYLTKALTGNANTWTSQENTNNLMQSLVYTANKSNLSVTDLAARVSLSGETLQKYGGDTRLAAAATETGLRYAQAYADSVGKGVYVDKEKTQADMIAAVTKSTQTRIGKELRWLASDRTNFKVGSKLEAMQKKLQAGETLSTEDIDYLNSNKYITDREESFLGGTTAYQNSRNEKFINEGNLSAGTQNAVVDTAMRAVTDQQFQYIFNEGLTTELASGFKNIAVKSNEVIKDDAAYKKEAQAYSDAFSSLVKIGIPTKDVDRYLSGNATLEADQIGLLKSMGKEDVVTLLEKNVEVQQGKDQEAKAAINARANATHGSISSRASDEELGLMSQSVTAEALSKARKAANDVVISLDKNGERPQSVSGMIEAMKMSGGDIISSINTWLKAALTGSKGAINEEAIQNFLGEDGNILQYSLLSGFENGSVLSALGIDDDSSTSKDRQVLLRNVLGMKEDELLTNNNIVRAYNLLTPEQQRTLFSSGSFRDWSKEAATKQIAVAREQGKKEADAATNAETGEPTEASNTESTETAVVAPGESPDKDSTETPPAATEQGAASTESSEATAQAGTNESPVVAGTEASEMQVASTDAAGSVLGPRDTINPILVMLPEEQINAIRNIDVNVG